MPSPQAADLPHLTREVAESFIAIDGRAELRVRPTEIRVVLAVTHEAPNARDCQRKAQETIDQLKTAWAKLDIAADAVVVDFIAVLPTYEWTVEKRGTSEVGVEKKSGYRLQTNVHLAVATEAKAQAALAMAFEQNITDIIAFDYWNRELDEAKTKARGLALKAARSKADLLLTEVFGAKPQAINVQEQTTVRFPESLYQSFERSSGESIVPNWRREMTLIGAHRPQNTYYRGSNSDGDVQPRELPMNPEISVVSHVRLYFASPAAKHAK